jgi:hypothetical protein
MTDVFTLLALFYFVLKGYHSERNKYYVLGIAGGIAIFLSNVAPIILATCGLYLLYEQFFVKKNKKIAALFAVFAVWLSLFALYYAFFIHNHPLREYMVNWWSEVEAFSPHNPFKSHLYLFLFAKTKMILHLLSLHLILPPIEKICIPPLTLISKAFLIIITIGIVALIRSKNIKAIMLMFVPIILHLFLSAFKLYPFDTRLILYTLPCLMIICAFGFESILRTVFSKLNVAKSCSLAIIIPCVSLFVGSPVKIEMQETKKCIKHINTNISETDAIYIYHGANSMFIYYDEIGLVKSNVRLINNKVGNWGLVTEYVNDIKNLHGKNWLLFATSFGEEKVIINQLDSIGYTKLDEFSPTGSSVYLYDFGE